MEADSMETGSTDPAGLTSAPVSGTANGGDSWTASGSTRAAYVGSVTTVPAVFGMFATPIQAMIDTIAATRQSVLDVLATPVEAVVDTIAAMVEAVLDTLARVGG